MWTGVNWLYKPTREFFTMGSVSRNRTSCHNFTISQKGWCENGGIDRFFKDTPGGSGYVETWESSRGCSWTQLLLASSYLCFISHDGSIHGAGINQGRGSSRRFRSWVLPYWLYKGCPNIPLLAHGLMKNTRGLNHGLPSGKRVHNYRTSPFWIGNSTTNGVFSIANC